MVQSWSRNHDNPHQVKGVFLGARFMNDTIRSNATFPRDANFALEPRQAYRDWADGIAVDRLLPVLTNTCWRKMHQGPARWSTYTLSVPMNGTSCWTRSPTRSCRWQNDSSCHAQLQFVAGGIPRQPHHTPRDDIIRGFVKHQSRYVKRAPTHDCYQLFVDYFHPADD